MARDGYCLSPEPGLRPGRTRHAKRDLNPVQGPLRSYLRSAAQGHAGHNNGPFAFRPSRVLVLSVRRNSAGAMPSQIHFRANFFRLFCPLSSPSSSCHFSFLPIKTKNQSTPLISFLGLSFWKKGPREHNIIRSKREQKQPLSRKIHDYEPKMLRRSGRTRPRKTSFALLKLAR